MNDSKLSIRYSKALFDLAKEKDLLEGVYQDSKTILEALKMYPELMALIENPVISPSKKSDVLQSIFSKHINKISLDFLNLICENQREQFLIRMLSVFIDSYRKEKGILDVEIVTAVEMDQSNREKIKEDLSKSFNAKIELSERVDQDIIGGIILNYDFKQLDASIKAQINKIRAELKKTEVKS